MNMSMTAAMAMVLATGGVAGANVPRAVIATSGGLAVIPGQGGAVVSSFTQSQIRLSSSGEWWAMTVNASGQPATNDVFILLGTEKGVQHVVPETVVLPGVGFGFTGRPNAQLGVNNAGDLAFRVTTTAPAATNDMVISYRASTGQYEIVAREGSPVPNVAGEVYSPFLDSVTLLNDGRVAFRAGSTTGPLPSDFSDFVLLSGSPQTTVAQSGVLIPTNQVGGTSGALIDIFDEAYVAEDGVSSIVEGALNVVAANSRVLVVNGAVVLQAGVTVPGLMEPPLSGFVDELRMFPAGDWATWGATVSGISFLLVNGSLAVAEGDAVVGGVGGETVVTVRDASMNSRGDLAYAVSTSRQRTVIIVDPVAGPPFLAVTTFGSTVNVLEGTQLDITGDGVADDAFASFFSDDTLALGDNGALYFQVRAASAQTLLSVGDALFVTAVNLGVPACYANCDGSTAAPVLNALDFACFLSRYHAGEAYANCDASTAAPVLNALDFACFLDRYRGGCR